jgi:hypothetical protein
MSPSQSQSSSSSSSSTPFGSPSPSPSPSPSSSSHSLHQQAIGLNEVASKQSSKRSSAQSSQPYQRKVSILLYQRKKVNDLRSKCMIGTRAATAIMLRSRSASHPRALDKPPAPTRSAGPSIVWGRSPRKSHSDGGDTSSCWID